MGPLLLGSAVAWAAPENVEAVQHALAMRHPVPCEELEALTPSPVETLLHVVDTVEMPPWAPMRAAQCLIDRHPLEVRSSLEIWVVEPALKGLGRLVLGALDTLPVEVALPVGRKALEGSDPVFARARLQASSQAELRALVGSPE